MSQTSLSIYLQDHLAGATAGVRLARRCADAGGHALARVASEIEEDRETLVRLMDALGIRASASKNAAAWVAERLSRLESNGRLRGRPAMQRLHELELLSLGIAGKLALWEAIQASAAAVGVAGINLPVLAVRARDQREVVEAERLAAAQAAFGSDA